MLISLKATPGFSKDGMFVYILRQGWTKVAREANRDGRSVMSYAGCSPIICRDHRSHFHFHFGYSESLNSHSESKVSAYREVTQVTCNFLCHRPMAQREYRYRSRSHVLSASTAKRYFLKVTKGNSEVERCFFVSKTTMKWYRNLYERNLSPVPRPFITVNILTLLL